MPRIPRMLVTDQPAVYHVISRTALQGLPITDTDKEVFLKILKFLASVYFVDILGFCIMGNDFHLLVQTYPQEDMSDNDAKAISGQTDLKGDDSGTGEMTLIGHDKTDRRTTDGQEK